MGVDKKHWISNGAELVQSGDLVQLRGYDGEWSEWWPADHLAGTRVDSFVGWHGGDVHFARVPTAAPEPQWEMVSDRDYILRPGVDQVRCRTYLNESGHWGPWIAWYTVQELQTVGGFVDGPGGTAAAQEWQFRRRVAGTQPAAEQPAPEQPSTPTPDRGGKYHRTIRQSLPGDTHGLCLTVDVYDVCRAFGVTCSATQHAIKKLLSRFDKNVLLGSKRLRALFETFCRCCIKAAGVDAGSNDRTLICFAQPRHAERGI